jgi:hypothetical protein
MQNHIVYSRPDVPSENFEQQGVRLHSLTTFDIVLQTAMKAGQFSDDDFHMIQDWFTDPTGWATRHGFEAK